MSLAVSLKDFQNTSLVSIGGASIHGERAKRSAILKNVLERTKSFLHTYDDPTNLDPVESVLKKITQIAPNVASVFQSFFTPVAMFFNSKEIKDTANAANHFSTNNNERHKYLGQFLIALVDSGVSAGALVSPLILGPAGNLILAVRAGAAFTESLRILQGKDDTETRIAKIATKLAKSPLLEKALSALAKKISSFEEQIHLSVTNMKLSTTSPEVLKHFDEFYKGYEAAYPAAQQESKENMLKYLANDNEWNVHLIKAGEELLGGFTTFLVEAKDGKKHLMVEQIYAKDKNAAWEVIQAYADSIGADSMWHEVQREEQAPPGFAKVHAPHGQPALLGQEIGDDSLVMTCRFSDGRTAINANDYREIVLKGWLSNWAHPDDPILRRLCNEIPSQGLIATEKTERGFSVPSLEYELELLDKIARPVKLTKGRGYQVSLKELAKLDISLAHQIINEIYPGYLKAFPFASQQSALEQLHLYLDPSASTDINIIFTRGKKKFKFAGAFITSQLNYSDNERVGYLSYVWANSAVKGIGKSLVNLVDQYFKENGIERYILEANDPKKMSKQERNYDTTWSMSPEAREAFYIKAGFKKTAAYYEQGAIQPEGEGCNFLSIWCRGFEKPITLEQFDILMRELYLGEEPWDREQALFSVANIRQRNAKLFGKTGVIPFI